MAKKSPINYSSTTGGAIMLVVGILILIFPNILEVAIGITLIILGILALTKK